MIGRCDMCGVEITLGDGRQFWTFKRGGSTLRYVVTYHHACFYKLSGITVDKFINDKVEDYCSGANVNVSEDVWKEFTEGEDRVIDYIGDEL